LAAEEPVADAFDMQPSAAEAAPDIEDITPPAEEAPAPPPITEEAEEVPPAPAVQEPAAESDVSEIWAEAEFYFQQGLFNEAKKHYARIIELNPGESMAIDRLAEISREEEDTLEFTKLADAVERLEGAPPSEDRAREEMPLSETDEEAVRSLMKEITRLKQPPKKLSPPPPGEEEVIALPPRMAAPPEPPSPPQPPQKVFDAAGPATTAGAEEDYFDLGAELAAESAASAPVQQEKQSGDFFDLASELRDELSLEAPAPRAAPSGEQSLDDIFEEFKRGVENQSVKEDADTHYNLGVAYREMGLLDDAIAEFTMTTDNEPKFVQSRYMLGLCFMEKGEYQNAIGEIQNALDNSATAGEGAHNLINMHYDLGFAYQGAGNIAGALREFQKVQSIDPNYRDVAIKIKEFRQGDYISLDQLKDDIGKEISAKFLEEGERIEREEKTRKNEKVRS
jgi:tetratricopeptide (TPR) repeat protein